MPELKAVLEFVLVASFIVSLLMFAIGTGFFIWGFWTYRKYRVLAVTAEPRIRGVAMGLVELHGKATGDTIFTSPVTRAPCLFYRVQIDSYSGPRNPPDVNGMADWNCLYSEIQGESFYLEDETGKIKVFPRLAEMEVPFTTRLVKVYRDEEKRKQQPAADAALADYVHTILKNRDFAATSGVTDPAAKLVVQLLQKGHYGTYRVGESCIFAGTPYEVTGTCVENPHPQGPSDRNLIVKGKREPLFVISSKGERATEENLRLRARGYVFRGAVAMGVSLAVWLVAASIVPVSFW